MPCFHPVTVWPGPSGGRVVFDATKSYNGSVSFEIPCNKCIGCRLAKAQQWATRMVHESKLYDDNAFVTLTYSDEHLPADGSLDLSALQRFFKRLRARLSDRSGSDHKIRFFAAGEYGDLLLRPHYHAIIFNFWPHDARKWRQANGVDAFTYRSAFLEEVWPYGHVETGRVTQQSCAYVARYVFKKITGEPAKDRYLRPHPVTGHLHQVIPEFAVMSRRPGIGSGWFDRYARDFFPSDFCVIDGQKVPVPVFYKKKLNELDQLVIVQRRKQEARKPQRLENKTPERLSVREELQTLRARQLKRSLE